LNPRTWVPISTLK